MAQWRKLHISGTFAWLLWAFVHAMLLLDLRSQTLDDLRSVLNAGKLQLTPPV